MNSRAQAEVTIREALRELDLWGAAATFNLTEYTGSSKCTLTLIKDWKDIVNQVDIQAHRNNNYRDCVNIKVTYSVMQNAIVRLLIYLTTTQMQFLMEMLDN